MPNSPPPEHAVPGTSDGEASARSPPRLKLEIDKRLLRLVRSFRVAQDDDGRAPLVDEDDEEEEDQGEPARREGRRKPRRVAVRSLQYGQRKIDRGEEVDIAAIFHYRTKKIVCQLRRRPEDPLVRFDILWSKIWAMSACFDDDRFDTMRIEVKASSERYHADPPPPGMHIQWRRQADLAARSFCLQFDKGTLERGYGKMLYTDPSLIELPLPPPPAPPGPPEEEDEEIWLREKSQR